MEKGFSIEQSRTRWKEIAEYIKAGTGRTTRHAVRHFGVSYRTVQNACNAHGVTPRQAPVSTLEILAQILNTTLSYEHIGAERGISKQAVHDVAKRATKAGIVLPSRSKRRQETK